MDELIEAASEAVQACASYSRYASLKELFEKYKAEIQALPTKEEYEAGQSENDVDEGIDDTDNNADTETDISQNASTLASDIRK